jgi:hypothetical protein
MEYAGSVERGTVIEIGLLQINVPRSLGSYDAISRSG